MNYQQLILDTTQILALYEANQWTNYTRYPDRLIEGIQSSLYCYAAYDQDTLIGLIRVVGDGQTIIYIQDILVLPSYHRKGVGTTLMKHVLKRYKDVRQVVLTTDKTDAQQRFYEALDFVSYDALDLVGYFQKK